ncbi:class I SAM-dependent methyltransferase [Nocardia callitridis]|uniref:S-adenosyl-L-methionine-dependent methyltransferase n=1 Tax=Nocardia callitridis TaxID=648753 RepID=A0ABP9KRZ1_9NOCA
MQTGQPSQTAFAAAYARAYHQEFEDLRIFTDPLATAIIGEQTEDFFAVASHMFGDLPENQTLRDQAHLMVAARARLAEDTVAAAVENGTTQVVVLGAGLDTFAYRNPFPGLQVFEVDHPDTQAWKRERLAAADIAVPETLTFSPVDFETGTLADGLAAAGFRRDEPAVFVWLGVVMYLTLESIRATLRFIIEQPGPTSVVIDYLGPLSSVAAEHREAMAASAELIAGIGEPVLSYFTPEEIDAELRVAGFDKVENFNPPALIAEYLDRPSDDTNSMGAGFVRATHL